MLARVLVWTAVAPLTLLLLTARTALAEDYEVEGVLNADSPTLAAGEYYALHTLEAQAGQRLYAVLESADFDAYLILLNEADETLLANDDFVEGSTTAGFETVIETAGLYQLLVTTVAAGEVGAYTLRVTLEANSSGDVRDSIEGMLDADCPTLTEGEYYATYTITGAPGAWLTVQMSSAEVDSYLLLLDPDGDVVAQNDDADETTVDATLEVQLEQAGTYTIMCTTAAGGDVGRFVLTLALTGMPPVAGVVLPPIPDDAIVVSGALDANDDTLNSGEYCDAITLEVEAGQAIDIRLESSDFDAWLFVRGPNGGQWDNDDHDGMGTNSRIALRLDTAGTYEINVTTYEAGQTGAYTLTYWLAAPQADSYTPVTITLDTPVVNGDLRAGDNTLSSGEYVDWFEYESSGTEGFAVMLTSAAFDAYVFILGPAGGDWSNDDVDPTQSNAGLSIELAAPGVYRLAVTSFAPGESGAYTLAIASALQPGTTANGLTPPRGARSAAIVTTGELADGDTALNTGEWIDWVPYVVEEGMWVLFHLESEAFYPYMMVTAPDGTRHEVNAATDPSGNAHLSLECEPGEYRLGLTSLRPGDSGAYRLTIEPGMRPGQPWATPFATEGNRRFYGIFVGISDYSNGDDNDLPMCRDDAEKLARALTASGLANSSTVEVLVDGEATGANIMRAFTRMASRVGPDDVFVFFYSGHGYQDKERNDQLDPQFEPDLRQDYLAVDDGLILDNDLDGMLDMINAGLIICCLDCCFSGGFERDVISAPNRLGLFSSEEDLTSAVAGDFEAGGYLSIFFREAVMGCADENGDGMVNVGEFCHYLQSRFGENVTSTKSETMSGAHAWQHLVVSRGGVTVDTLLLKR